jgi:hypothetical protein
MGYMTERAIQVHNGEACPQCLGLYPTPTDFGDSIACSCGFVQKFVTPQSSVMTNNTRADKFECVGPKSLKKDTSA